MSAFDIIENKINQFIRKYYKNELIKGVIMFFSLGAIYLIFILLIENFLWLRVSYRAILFWLFIAVELYFLIRFILSPLIKLIGFRKGISYEESSKIIGNHFPEVKDKLLNILQLKNDNSYQSDLIIASINQKSKELQPIPFTKAVDFSKNKKYLKYAVIPIVLYFISLLTISTSSLRNSFKRVIDYNTAYKQPAPFEILLDSKDLSVVQGKDKTVNVIVKGNKIPNDLKINFKNQEYFLQKTSTNSYTYNFKDVQDSFRFYFEANNVFSEEYQIDLIKTPTINNISVSLNYPSYTRIKNKKYESITNLTIPEGTTINWLVKTNQTDTVKFVIRNDNLKIFNKINDEEFRFNKTIYKSLSYQITTSNKNLNNYEKLNFNVDIIKDEFPKILVQTNIDSITRGKAQFAGQISDDYGISKLQLIYYNVLDSEQVKSLDLDTTKENIQSFYYEFPDFLDLQQGEVYEFYFKVFDNDRVNGKKFTKSRVFKYKQKSKQEIEQEVLEEQRNTIQSLEKSLLNQKREQKTLNNIQQDLQNKKSLNWNDKNKVDKYLKRQEKYKKMMQRQTNDLQKNLDDFDKNNKQPNENKEDLKKRIEELKNLEKQQKLLDEIQKMADKLNKEDLVKKAKELAQQNRQQQRSLEKTLEMVKRFYVEQKTMQIANKLKELSKQQLDASNNENSLEKQKEIKQEFDKIKKELNDVKKDNENLKEPLSLPDVDSDQKEIDKMLDKAQKELESSDNESAKKSQKSSSKKMNEMSSKMQKALLEMQGDTLEENMDDLRKILENLVLFSFEQEELVNDFKDISTNHPQYGKNLKKQNQIKTYFEHIDDSLYVLSMRVPKISIKIQNDLTQAHYNLDQSLENFSEAKFDNGIANQRYVITAANNLSDYLSNILNNMKNSMSMKMGKGKKGKGSGFSLPDLIKKQEGLSQKMKDGLEKGKQKGKGKNGEQSGEDNNGEGKEGDKQGKSEGRNGDDLDAKLFEIYKQQNQLRQELENAIKEGEGENPGAYNNAKKALKTMEQLENEILQNGFNKATLQKMQNLNYELLKLDKAQLEQGEEKKRKSYTSKQQNKPNSLNQLKFKKQFYNQIEILNRHSLPLQQNYKKKVRAYFSDIKQ